MTWSSRSAAVTSSSVARKAATTLCGSFWMNPTVSTSSTSRPGPKSALRTSGSSVMKSWSDTSVSARVSALNSVDLPALV